LTTNSNPVSGIGQLGCTDKFARPKAVERIHMKKLGGAFIDGWLRSLMPEAKDVVHPGFHPHQHLPHHRQMMHMMAVNRHATAASGNYVGKASRLTPPAPAFSEVEM
jgi:predicted metal-dependent hydrolase